MNYTCGRYLCNPINGGGKGTGASLLLLVVTWGLLRGAEALPSFRPSPSLPAHAMLMQAFGEMMEMPYPP